jgi:hypothetical protein
MNQPINYLAPVLRPAAKPASLSQERVGLVPGR